MRSIIEYNKAIAEMRFRKGTTLVDREVYLAEGNWHPAAAPFAMQRAINRTRSKDAHRLRTEPMEFVGGAAPGSWESLGTNTRPSIPGAMNESAEQPMTSPQNVPNVPQIPPMAPPAIEDPAQPQLSPETVPRTLEPMPVPPADEPLPKPPSEVLTRTHSQVLQLMNSRRLAPIADETDNAGRVSF